MVYDFEEGINEEFRLCFQKEIERHKKKQEGTLCFLSLGE
jgi:hypothetical protein